MRLWAYVCMCVRTRVYVYVRASMRAIQTLAGDASWQLGTRKQEKRRVPAAQIYKNGQL